MVEEGSRESEREGEMYSRNMGNSTSVMFMHEFVVPLSTLTSKVVVGKSVEFEALMSTQRRKMNGGREVREASNMGLVRSEA